MTQEDKYAVVVDGQVVDTVRTKKEGQEALKAVDDSVEAEVRPLDPDKDFVKPKKMEHLR